MVIIIGLLTGERYKEIPYYKYITQMETIKIANEQWLNILNTIKESDEKDVVIYTETIYAPLLKTPGITGDADDWVNQYVAKVYHKNSVQIIWTD
jgi:hypothetical protein